MILMYSLSLDDLKRCGEKYVCPYYYARAMLAKADIITLNYQYILDPHISNIILPHLNNSNNILLFDEGHNIENIICENHSIRITSSQLDDCWKQLTKYICSSFHAEQYQYNHDAM